MKQSTPSLNMRMTTVLAILLALVIPHTAAFVLRVEENFRREMFMDATDEQTVVIQDGDITSFSAALKMTSGLFPPFSPDFNMIVMEWMRGADEYVAYEIRTSSSNESVLLAPQLSIPSDGCVPSGNFTPFSVAFPCLAVDGMAYFNFTLNFIVVKHTKEIGELDPTWSRQQCNAFFENITDIDIDNAVHNDELLGPIPDKHLHLSFAKACRHNSTGSSDSTVSVATARSDIPTVAAAVPAVAAGGSTDSSVVVIAVAVSVSATAVLVVMTATLCLLRWRKEKRSTAQLKRGLQPPSSLFCSPELMTCGMIAALESPYKIISPSILDIGERVGGGRYGVVYKATMTKNANIPGMENRESQVVAVKKIKASTESQTAMEGLYAELILMESLEHHPNVVATLFGGLLLGSPCIIMEYMCGGDLHSYLRRLKSTVVVLKNVETILPLSKITDVSLQVAKGMEFLAEKQIVHRDLAARNILIRELSEEFLEAKISDLGLSRKLFDDQMYHSKTPRALPLKWMAPECIKDGVFSSKSDVWAFGVLLWEVLTSGEMPYSNIPVFMLLTSFDQGKRLHRPQSCPDELYEVMSSSWRGDPEERPTFKELVKSLSYLDDQTKNYLDFFATDGKLPAVLEEEGKEKDSHLVALPEMAFIRRRTLHGGDDQHEDGETERYIAQPQKRLTKKLSSYVTTVEVAPRKKRSAPF
ncbi:fibroblast growth factor receptor 3-like [Sycon ciliatum]|uniref:fibroblast growth factor receptor 3-like n=1 Tax=Sycon ciliatum TaxID=27933 RepID=UPI0031F6C53D